MTFRFRQLAVFDVPAGTDLSARLSDICRAERFHLVSSWTYATSDWDKGIPVRHWEGSIDDLREDAGHVLNSLILPVLASDQPFCVSFPFSSAELRAQPLDIESRDLLDVEDIGTLLTTDVVATTFDLLAALQDRTVQTPIELELGRAMADAGIDARPQVRVGKYLADFLVETPGRKLVIEADGRGYHDQDADRRRDEKLRGLGIDEVIRFTGSRIWSDSAGCAAVVQQHIQAGGQPPTHNRTNLDEDLDASQLKAIDHSIGPARVLAPAGAGKTKTMVNRVVKLIRGGVSPGSVLVLAFNRKAARQLENQLRAHGIPVSARLDGDSRSGVVCKTFNAFGLRYQRDIAGLDLETQADGNTWRQIMDGALADCGIDLHTLRARRGSDPLGEFLGALDRVRAGLQMPGEIDVEIESFADDGNPVYGFGPVHGAFETRQLDMRVQSFDDQIYIAVRDLLGVPQHRQLVQRRFSHVLVDEYQDLNAAQLALVDVISRPLRNLFVVGDDDQLIYGWRFARVENILEFHHRMPTPPFSATYTLSTNYRCARSIVDASRRLIDHNRLRAPKNFAARIGAPGGAVRFVGGDTWARRADELSAFLISEKDRLKCRWRELAVLCRFKSQQVPVAMALDAAGIPRSRLLSYRLFTHPAARLLRAYLSLVIDPENIDGDELSRLLNRPNRYIANEAVRAVCAAPSPWSALAEWVDGNGIAPRAIPDLVARVSSINQGLDRSSSLQVIDDVVREFGLERFWQDALKDGTASRQDEADRCRCSGCCARWQKTVPAFRGS